jgi:hypothetical protein
MSAGGVEFASSGTDPAKLQAYGALLATVFGAAQKFAPEAIAWRYRDNPAGEVVGTDAWAGTTLAAHYVTCPTRAVVDGQPLKGLLSLNTATHPDFQGQGLFTRLAEATYGAGAQAGSDFVVGVANANSTPGFIRKLGFQLVAPLAAGALLAPPRRLAARPVRYAADWSPELLAWRLANPAARYGARRRGALTRITAATHLPLVRCAAYLPEVAVAPSPASAGADLFIGLEPRLDLSQHGFVALPQRFRPSPLNLIYKPLSARAPATLEAGEVALSFLDFDPY